MVDDSLAFLSKTAHELTKRGIPTFAYLCQTPTQKILAITRELPIDYVGPSSEIGVGLVKALQKSSIDEPFSSITEVKLLGTVFDRDLGSSSQDGPNALKAITERASMFKLAYPGFYYQIAEKTLLAILLTGETEISSETRSQFSIIIHKCEKDYLDKIVNAVRKNGH